MPEFTAANLSKPSLRARLAAFALRKSVDVAAWRWRREEAKAAARWGQGQTFRAFVQINVAPRAR